MAQITLEEIQETLQENDYMAICQGDDSVAEECLANARIYVSAVAESCGVEYDEDDSVLRLAVKKKTLAELYGYAAEWTAAEKYNEETTRLLAPLVPSENTVNAAYTESGRRDWYGY